MADEKSPTVVVPTKAIVTFAGIEKVIMVEAGKAIEKSITTGRHTDDWTEVLSPDSQELYQSTGLASAQRLSPFWIAKSLAAATAVALNLPPPNAA